MLTDEQFRLDCLPTVRKILSQKTWNNGDCAAIMMHAANYMYKVIERAGCIRFEVGGKMNIYACDLLELFEQQCGLTFPEERARWEQRWNIPPGEKPRNRLPDKNRELLL